MRRTLMLLAATLLVPAAADAQTIRGTVVEDGTRQPIHGAVVELRLEDGTRFATAQSNEQGMFLLSVRRAGTYTLHLAHIAYTSVNSEAFSLRQDESVQMELRLARTTIPLEPLVVTARSSGHLEGFRERSQRRGSAGYIMTREQIEARPGASATTLLREVPGVIITSMIPPGPRVQDPTAQEGGVIDPVRISTISMRSGTGECSPTVFIDGMVAQQAGPVSGIDDLLRPEFLEGVEVYHGGAVPPPLYGRDGCGVVAFWTRPGGGSRFSWAKLGGGVGAFIASVAVGRALAR